MDQLLFADVVILLALLTRADFFENKSVTNCNDQSSNRNAYWSGYVYGSARARTTFSDVCTHEIVTNCNEGSSRIAQIALVGLVRI